MLRFRKIRVVQHRLCQKWNLSTDTVVSQPLIDFLKDMKRELQASQKELKADLLASQLAAETRMDISQKELKADLQASQKELKADLQASQKELKADNQRMMNANNYKLATMVVSAVIAGIALFESVGGAIQYPWREIRQGSNLRKID